MKYVTVVIAKDPRTGQLVVDQAATQARVAEVRMAEGLEDVGSRPSGGKVVANKVTRSAAKKVARKAARKSARPS